MAKKAAAAPPAEAAGSSADLRSQAAELLSQAEEVEASEKEAAKQEALDNETPEQTEARELSEAEAVKQAADAEVARKLVEEPTDEQKATTIGIDTSGVGSYSYMVVPEPVVDNTRARRLLISGKNYEHVAEDRFGRWLYRAM